MTSTPQNNPKPERTRYSITLDAVPDEYGREPAIRLRLWLKIGLRRFGLRCTSFGPADAKANQDRQHEHAPNTIAAPDAPQQNLSTRRSAIDE